MVGPALGSGTEGSNPACSNSESANHRFSDTGTYEDRATRTGRARVMVVLEPGIAKIGCAAEPRCPHHRRLATGPELNTGPSWSVRDLALALPGKLFRTAGPKGPKAAQRRLDSAPSPPGPAPANSSFTKRCCTTCDQPERCHDAAGTHGLRFIGGCRSGKAILRRHLNSG